MLNWLLKQAKLMVRVGFWMLIAIAGILIWNYTHWTFQAAAKEEFYVAAAEASEIHATEVRNDLTGMNALFRKTGFDPRIFRDRLVGNALITNQGRAAVEEANKTADGETVRQAVLFVDAMNPQWQGHITFAGPLMIYGVSGYVETDSGDGKFTSTADGIQATGMEAFPLPLNNKQLHLALVGRVCDTAGCTGPFFVGSGKTLCPAQMGKTGWVELKVNQHDLLVHDDKGGYSYNHKPAPSEACP